MNVKQELLNQCKNFVDIRSQTIQKTMSSYQNDLQSESKSSAGDKHETGRAMLQLEMEKASQQLEGINQMSQILDKIDASKTSKVIRLGSIVFTENRNYFLSISAGKFSIENIDFFAVSAVSPIGKILLGKKESDEILFQGKVIKIKKID